MLPPTLILLSTVLLLSSQVSAYPPVRRRELEARQSSTIKQTVGNWQYQGCYLDLGPRVLQNRFTIASGNDAEQCTSLCHDKGYLYAGMEYGTECWCDNHLAYETVTNDSDCNFPCPGDGTELCGAGNRLTLYMENPATSIMPKIKQTVGTWLYKGCYADFGPRILTFRFDVPGGNNAEKCTTLCHSQGYGLAGLEYGTECWCDNYLPYGPLMPDRDCSFKCPGDSSELCGAGNRMVLYQDSAATPPDSNTCITWRDRYTFQNNDFQAIPKSGSGDMTRLYAVPADPISDVPRFSIISNCPDGCPYSGSFNFGLVDNILGSYGAPGIAPNVGESQIFQVNGPAMFPTYAGYCAKPNPVSPSGPFIGYPVLSIAGHADLWGLCANTTADGRLDIVYSPVANHPHYDKSSCQDVYIQITPYGT